MFKILGDFLYNRKQSKVLNGQCSFWVDIRAGFSQGSIFKPLLFMKYIIDLSNDLKSESKLCADDISLFSVAHYISTSDRSTNSYSFDVRLTILNRISCSHG